MENLFENVEYQSLGEEERQRVDEALDIYEATNPKPELILPSFWDDNWLETIGLFLSAIGTIIISALRVGTILFLAEISLASFYEQAAANSPWLQFILQSGPTLVGIAGLFGFEGYLFAAGLRDGKQSEKIRISNWGIFIGFLVTMSAGLLSSFGLNQEENIARAVVTWIVIVSTGIGAPALAYFGAFNIGVLNNSHISNLEAVRNEHYESMKEWQRGFENWYKKSAYNIWGVDRRTLRRTTKDTNEVVVNSSSSGETIQEQVANWLEENNLLPTQIGAGDGYVMTPKQIANAIGLDNSPVRVALHRLRKDIAQ